ncbi:MAG TPA: MFS transporter [Bryobacteraceae bacterium]
MRPRRWWIVGLFFLSTVINYMDRQTLSILAQTIQNDLHLTDIDYSHIVQMFLLAYTVAYVAAGRITDWLGTRIAMAAFIFWWSLADFCTGFATTGAQLAGLRFLLGLGEPGNWTAAPKAISELFKPRERGLALGLNTAGATIGATLAPPVIVYLSLHYGWRSAFSLTGALGALWIAPWLLVYRPPAGVRRVREKKGSEWKRWKTLLSERETWLLTVLRLLTDPVWYFYLFWFPKYLSDARHLTLRQLGHIAWVIYLAADLGSILGGFAVSKWIARGGAPVLTEQRTMTVLACLMPLGFLIPFTPSLPMALLLAGLVAFGQLAWQTITTTLAVNYFSSAVIATVFGIIAAGSGLGGLISTGLIGHVVTSGSYAPVFIAMAALHPASLLLLWRVRRNRAQSYAR